MTNSQLLAHFANLSDESIQDKFHNKVDPSTIVKIIEAKNDIFTLLTNLESGSFPVWIIDSVNSHAESVLKIYNNNSKPSESSILNAWNTLYLNRINSPGSDYTYLNIPQIQSWIYAHRESMPIIDIEKLVETKIKDNKTDLELNAQETIDILDKTRRDADKTILLLQQASGKVAVERYAAIFGAQAQAYSFERSNVDTEAGEKVPLWLFAIFKGKASLWLISAFAFCALLIIILFNIDDFISIPSNTWTPNSVAHLIGRSIIISLNIFLISFCFKQYRINKHLHTLNLHRANTLKSFEYLTKAPDKLDPASYNAILMKVAESIYNAGHTGYVSSSEQNLDMPSIIDMTKVITSGGKE